MALMVRRCRCFALPGGAALLTESSALRFRETRDPELFGARARGTGVPDLLPCSWRAWRGW
eukprot:3555606-Pyramimonas_sp.AAC.1